MRIPFPHLRQLRRLFLFRPFSSVFHSRPSLYLSLFFALSLLFGLFAFQFYEAQFRLSNIQFLTRNDAPRRLVEYSENTSTLSAMSAQKFTYLDRGKQSYVFLSEDGNYVLKFFDARALQINPFFSSASSLESLKRKEERLFEGYDVAYRKSLKHAGILFMRLEADPSLWHKVLVRDRFGIWHEIPLNAVPFVIQKKAVPTRTVMTDLLQRGDLKEAKAKLRLIIDLYLEEYGQGIYDEDHNFMYNTGFAHGKPMRLDLGRLREDRSFMQREIYFNDLKKVALERVEGWMRRHFPQYRQEIIEDMQAKLQELMVKTQ